MYYYCTLYRTLDISRNNLKNRCLLPRLYRHAIQIRVLSHRTKSFAYNPPDPKLVSASLVDGLQLHVQRLLLIKNEDLLVGPAIAFGAKLEVELVVDLCGNETHLVPCQAEFALVMSLRDLN